MMVIMQINHKQLQFVSHIFSCVQDSNYNFQTLVFGSKNMHYECLGEKNG